LNPARAADFPTRDPPARAAFLALAGLPTVALFALFATGPVPRGTGTVPERVVVLIDPARWSAADATPAAPAAADRQRPQPRERRPPPAAARTAPGGAAPATAPGGGPITVPAAADPAAPDGPGPAALAPSADRPASAPLKLDGATLRRAHQASKSAARTLAESSGAYFGDEPVHADDPLAGAVERAARPDCLSSNGGGSLLSVFVIPYMALKGKCK
jgi:hypothetical protein